MKLDRKGKFFKLPCMREN